MLGWFAMIWDNNLEEAARHYSKVNELLINGTRGDALLEALGRLDEAIELDEYRLKKDPLNAQLHAYLGKRYLYADRHNEAIASLTTAKLLSPKARFIDYNLGLAYLLDGQHETALKLFEQERAESARQRGLVLAYHALGKHQESDAVLAEYTRDKTCYARGLHPYRGEVDKAFEVLEACEAEGAGMGVVHISPLFRNLHGDPRWMHYLERNGVAPQQLEKIEFSVAIPHEQQQAMN